MKAIKAIEYKEYLKEIAGLERDYIAEILTSRKNAWRIAIIAGIISALSVLAVVALSPLKMAYPFVLRVDNATGNVDIINTMTDGETTYDEIIDKYWINQYVMNRESYDFATIQTLYDTTALLSTAEVQKEYYKLFQGDNARDNILSNRAKIVATINSLILNQQNSTATVRFTTQLNHANGINHTAKHWVATLAYEYLNAPMHEEDRLINPLGFQITSYRVDPEINTDQNETLDVGL